MKILVGDLVNGCTGRGGVVSSPAFAEFRRKWSHRLLDVATPIVPDDGFRMMYGCDSDLIWYITGPAEFLEELPAIIGFPCRMVLCRHEIIGD